jgi:hypothetical protein
MGGLSRLKRSWQDDSKEEVEGELNHAGHYLHRIDRAVFRDWDFLRSRVREIEVGGGLYDRG